ncbi:hypothetical protein BB560_001530 [Smittium megazygosporum]|uniref:Uncharacterized protein n=1 Tax=Smittium megazygosporum TaxID=133381 RepID=A0A2T9ZH92_9FUNG|nr:hypothetical protein BB560_001530 [Smittium megazygosporum]
MHSRMNSANTNKNKGGSALGSLDFVGLYKTSKKSSKKVGDLGKDTASGESQNKELQNKTTSSKDAIKAVSFPDDPEIQKSLKIPYTKSVLMKGHSKPVTAISWTSSGDRLATGGGDYLVKLWNFGSMNESFKYFQSFEPIEGCQINDLAYSSNGENLLVVTTSSQPKLYDKQGILVEEYKKGILNITDPRKTNGHLSSINCCEWNPQNAQEFLTASDDSTIRIWDPEVSIKSKNVIVCKSTKNGWKTNVTACVYSQDGKAIISGHSDGSISLWANSIPFKLKDAHTPGNIIASLEVSQNGNLLLSKSEDRTVKVWDLRNLKDCLAASDPLYSFYPKSNACFSPTGKLVATSYGLSRNKSKYLNTNSLEPRLVFLDTNTLKVVSEKVVSTNNFGSEQDLEGDSDLIKVLWHNSLNQIAITNSSGNISVFYDDTLSKKGAIIPLTKPSKGKSSLNNSRTSENIGRIITPHSLSSFRDTTSGSSKRRMMKIRKDPIASRRPELPVKGQGKGGVIGTNEDPREALLKYAAAAEESPYWVAPAYKKRQPKPIFDETGMADEPEIKRRK